MRHLKFYQGEGNHRSFICGALSFSLLVLLVNSKFEKKCFFNPNKFNNLQEFQNCYKLLQIISQ